MPLFWVVEYVRLEASSRMIRCASLYFLRSATSAVACASMTSVGETSCLVGVGSDADLAAEGGRVGAVAVVGATVVDVGQRSREPSAGRARPRRPHGPCRAPRRRGSRCREGRSRCRAPRSSAVTVPSGGDGETPTVADDLGGAGELGGLARDLDRVTDGRVGRRSRWSRRRRRRRPTRSAVSAPGVWR